jgi:2-hydroxy-3-keto-5-methylthiopentenyl-1-phosphate phosphatase
MIVVSDFDGTLTIEDVTALIWDTYLPYDWRATLLPPTYDGTWSPLEMIARGYAGVHVPPDRLLAEIRGRVRLRPGVEALATFCRGRGWPFAVASHGLAFYLEALLPSWIPYSSFVGNFVDGKWEVSLPPDLTLARGEDFKTRVIAGLRARHPGRPVAYIGDGRLDLTAAQNSERAFAVRGSRLARLLRESGREVTEFSRLDEVAAEL